MAETIAVDDPSPPAEAVNTFDEADPQAHTSMIDGPDTSTAMTDVGDSMPATMSAPEAFIPQDLAMQHNPVTTADNAPHSSSHDPIGSSNATQTQSNTSAANSTAPSLPMSEASTTIPVEDNMDHEPIEAIPSQGEYHSTRTTSANEESLPDYAEAVSGEAEAQAQPETSRTEESVPRAPPPPSLPPTKPKITFDGTSLVFFRAYYTSHTVTEASSYQRTFPASFIIWKL